MVGDTIKRRVLRSVSGDQVCNLRLHSFSRRHREIAAAGIREAVVFHSTADDLRPYTTDLPFAVVADPDRRLYREFGVERSPRALLDPRAWPSILRGILYSLVLIVSGSQPVPSLNPHGGRFGLPADFLIARNGRVAARKYGRHADDRAEPPGERPDVGKFLQRLKRLGLGLEATLEPEALDQQPRARSSSPSCV